MKNYILLSSIIFTCQIIFPQDSNLNQLYAEYTIYANTESPRKLLGILEAKKDKTFYATIFNQKQSKIISKDISEIKVQLGSKEQIVYINYNDSTLTSTKGYRREDYKIIEKIPFLDWEIKSDSKKISNYNCNKAKVKFRGRDYTAWFTTKIPISSGPYKFHGLPGLILEIYDADNRFHWVISKIKFPYNSNKLKTIFEDNTVVYKEVALKSFVESQNNINTSNLKTKLPRGVTISVDYISKRNGIELIYEWEEKEKEKQ